MGKEKISIDDLFRQRFADREVPLPPGSWGRMEGLLDAKMPVGVAPVARDNGRRWAFLLLGLLAVGGGGFAYQQSLHKEQLLADASAKISPSGKRTVSAAPITSTIVEESHLSTAPQQRRGKAVPTFIKVVEKISPASVETGEAMAAVKPVKEHPVSAPLVKTAVPTPVLEVPVTSFVREEIPFLPSIASRLSDVFSGKILAQYNLVRVENYLFEQVANKENPALSTPERAWSAKTPSGTPQLSLPAQQMKTAGATASVISAAVASSVSPVTVPAANASAPTIPVAASVTPTASAQIAPTAPTAETPKDASQAAVAKIEDALDEVRNSQFSMGILAGINSTLSGGSGALQGLHAGLWGILKLSEKWSIGSDLKFLFRLNNSMDLKDDTYSSQTFNETSVTRNGQLYNAMRTDVDSTLRRYTFTSYNSIELPLYVRYSHNRFSVYGGPNVAFHFRPSVTRTDTKIGTVSRYDTLLASQPLPTAVSRPADVTFSDFDSRFSLGYLVGAQYRLSSALGLDLRLSHQVWDNLQNRSAGAGRVSTTYIQIPALQLSVNYRFCKKEPQGTVKKP